MLLLSRTNAYQKHLLEPMLYNQGRVYSIELHISKSN